MLCVHTSAFDSCAGGITVLWADSALCRAQYESTPSQHPPQDTLSPSVQAEAGKSLILPCWTQRAGSPHWQDTSVFQEHPLRADSIKTTQKHQGIAFILALIAKQCSRRGQEAFVHEWRRKVRLDREREGGERRGEGNKQSKSVKDR